MSFAKAAYREVSPTSSRLYTRFGKRLFDMAFVILVAPFVVPLVLAFAAMIRRDGGPAFFIQPRVGKDGRVFDCYKLRTMVVNAEEVLAKMCDEDPELAAEWHTYQKLTNDPRITRVGKFLRATSLDELPQFWNIFIGDMSLIGPRPFMPEQESLYSKDRSAAYFKLRPGVSGPWQTSARNESTFAERARFDEEYYETLSLKGDIEIVARTVGVVLGARGQ